MLMIIGHYKKADITNKSDIANKKGSVYVHSVCNVTLLMSFLFNIEKTMPSPRRPAPPRPAGLFRSLPLARPAPPDFYDCLPFPAPPRGIFSNASSAPPRPAGLSRVFRTLAR